MAEMKQLPSGNWNIRVYSHTDENGKVYRKSLTAPTKKELKRKVADFIAHREEYIKKSEMPTVGEAVDKYIELSSKSASVSTLAAYQRIREYSFKGLMPMNVADLNDMVCQYAINQECERKNERTGKPLSAKTVKNEWGLISTALRSVCKLTFEVKLPKVRRNTKRKLPEPREIADAVKGTKVELPVALAMRSSLRMSEIRGLMCSSIDMNARLLTIEQVRVEVNGLNILKDFAKTDDSLRTVPFSEHVARLIKETPAWKEWERCGKDGFVVDMSRAEIYHYYKSLLLRVGIDMSFHDLRHEYASVHLNKLGTPIRVVEATGGWAPGSSVLRNRYSESFSSAEIAAFRAADTYFDDAFDE